MTNPSLYIDGGYVPSTSGETFTTINPATGEVLAHIEVASRADVDRAIASAQCGFAEWSRLKGFDRGRVLQRAATLLRQRNSELAALEVSDTGKPIAEASTVDILSGAEALEYFGGIAATLHGDHVDLGGAFAYTRREPLGICAGIGAWNYPLQIACWKAAPALACGNAMIFKPSELTPLTALKLAEIFTEAGLPDGVFNVVQGPGSVGQLLSRDPRIAKISLTGEVETGKRVMADGASTLKHVSLELGGKSPLILFADCDLDQAVSAALLANFYTQGEICSNGTRVFVEESIREAFLEKLLPRVERLRVGDPRDAATQIGALISREHRDKVLRHIEIGRRDGARLLCGGKVPDWGEPQAALRQGFFVLPSVFSDCRDEMTIVREEIFGPVMSVLSFSDEKEVISRANATHFGLSAGVFTRDLTRAHRIVAQLQAGVCWINNYNVTPTEIPFGGVKQSGLGRENGLAAIQHYTQLKTVYVEMTGVFDPY